MSCVAGMSPDPSGITVKCWRLRLTVPDSVPTIYDFGVLAGVMTFPRSLQASVATHTCSSFGMVGKGCVRWRLLKWASCCFLYWPSCSRNDCRYDH